MNLNLAFPEDLDTTLTVPTSQLSRDSDRMVVLRNKYRRKQTAVGTRQVPQQFRRQRKTRSHGTMQ